MKREFWHGDCLELMRDIPDGSVDMILCDLPYGTTACSWDSIIPFEPLWEQYWRVLKRNGAVVLTAAQPFTTKLIASQIAQFKYCWVWHKPMATGFVHARNKPLKEHEDIAVFSRGTTIHASQSPSRMPYNPQMTEGEPYRKAKSTKGSKGLGWRKSHSEFETISNGERFPRSIISFSNADQRGKVHPTQKPVALFEYLIRTYTNPGETVLDNCAGSGTTAIAALNTGRGYICIERDDEYFRRATERVASQMI